MIVIMLSVAFHFFLLNVVKLRVVMLIGLILSVVMLSVVMLNAVAPRFSNSVSGKEKSFNIVIWGQCSKTFSSVFHAAAES